MEVVYCFEREIVSRSSQDILDERGRNTARSRDLILGDIQVRKQRRPTKLDCIINQGPSDARLAALGVSSDEHTRSGSPLLHSLLAHLFQNGVQVHQLAHGSLWLLAEASGHLVLLHHVLRVLNFNLGTSPAENGQVLTTVKEYYLIEWQLTTKDLRLALKQSDPYKVLNLVDA